MIKGSLEVKRPTIWTNEKQRGEESEKRRRKKSKKTKSQNKSNKWAYQMGYG
jgi:hypothetical protein